MPPLVVGYDAILEIEPDLYAQLIRDGACELNHDVLVEQSNRARTAPGVTEVCLALDRSRSDFWFEFEPETDLNLLLDWSCLATYDVATRQVRRTGASSLREELTLRTNAYTTPASGGPTSVPDAETRAFLPVKKGSDAYQHAILDKAFDTWQQTGTLFGQLAICGCMVSGCGATYAWLTGRTGLLVVGVSAASMFTVEIGPFPIGHAVSGNG